MSLPTADVEGRGAEPLEPLTSGPGEGQHCPPSRPPRGVLGSAPLPWAMGGDLAVAAGGAWGGHAPACSSHHCALRYTDQVSSECQVPPTAPSTDRVDSAHCSHRVSIALKGHR